MLIASCSEPDDTIDGQGFAKNPPFLVLNRDGGFGAYTGEILKAEGFNAYDLFNVDRAAWSLATLKLYDWVILPRIAVSDSALNDIVDFVKAGGNLVSFLPSAELLKLLNAGKVVDTVVGGYINIDPKPGIGQGLYSVPLKFHGEAIHVSRGDGEIIARFSSPGRGEPEWPAVISQTIGKGHALSFFYDLPKNVLVSRQGNPLFANKEMDGIFGFRATDLFTENWVDTSMNCLNHVDEQLHLLTHGIEELSNNKKPLPRFWYFPDTLNCLATLTNDGESSGQKDFIRQFKDVSAKGAKMTLYSLLPAKMNKPFADSLIREGFEIAPHPDAIRYADRPTWPVMTIAIRDKLAELKALHEVSGVTTIANHWFVWCSSDEAGNPDFTAQAKIESNAGIKLDINYAHYDNSSNQRHFLGASGKRQGNFEGSGLPMRFSDMEGKVLDIFQHFNNVYDQQYMEHRDSIGFFECFKGLVDRSLDEQVYSFISIKAHNDEYSFSRTPLMRMLDYAKLRNVPVWTAADLYQFLKVKDEASFSEFTYKRGTLFFTVNSALTNPNNLSFLIPFHFNGKSISAITGNDLSFPLIQKNIKGVDYARVTIPAGKRHVFRIYYN